MASMIRFHQLTGPNNKRVNWSLGSCIQYFFTDLPIKTVICGKKFVSAVKSTKLTYRLKIRNNSTTTPLAVTRDEIMAMLISQVQVDGTAMGTLISAASMKPGIIDTVDFVANGGINEGNVFGCTNVPAYTQASDRREIEFTVAFPFGYYGCSSPLAMAPMTSFIKSANFKVDAPTSVPAGSGFTIEDCTVTASATLIWRDEIIIPPGYQFTRFKSTATQGVGSDTIDLKSFGQNSTLTGVEQRAAIAGLFWNSSKVRGDGTGAGLVENITDFSALFAGIEQTNDLAPIVDELRLEYEREPSTLYPELTVGGNQAAIPPTGKYPLFVTEDNPDPNVTKLGQKNYARFLPVFCSRRKCHISKMPIADGSPSYNLTGNFTGSDHYSSMFGIYRWQEPQFNALVQILARDDIGVFLYGSNDLTDLAKLSKKNDPAGVNFSKGEFLPRKMLPKTMVEGAK